MKTKSLWKGGATPPLPLVAILGAGVTLGIPLTAHATPCPDAHDMKAKTPDPDIPQPKEREECIEREIFFMPGAHTVFYQPHGSPTPFYGGGMQVAPFQWSRNNDRFGPSQGSYYLQVAILGSTSSKSAMTLFETGGTLSFERNANRSWLIPYFGGNIGGMTQKEIGTSGFAYPLLGTHLYWHRNLMVDAEGGYHFPFMHIDSVRGPRAQITARFSLW